MASTSSVHVSPINCISVDDSAQPKPLLSPNAAKKRKTTPPPAKKRRCVLLPYPTLPLAPCLSLLMHACKLCTVFIQERRGISSVLAIETVYKASYMCNYVDALECIVVDFYLYVK